MLPDRVSNTRPHTYESGALPIALRGPAELPGHVHFCMGAYGEDSSRLRNFGGFKLVTNLKETKEAKCK